MWRPTCHRAASRSKDRCLRPLDHSANCRRHFVIGFHPAWHVRHRPHQADARPRGDRSATAATRPEPAPNARRRFPAGRFGTAREFGQLCAFSQRAGGLHHRTEHLDRRRRIPGRVSDRPASLPSPRRPRMRCLIFAALAAIVLASPAEARQNPLTIGHWLNTYRDPRPPAPAATPMTCAIFQTARLCSSSA